MTPSQTKMKVTTWILTGVTTRVKLLCITDKITPRSSAIEEKSIHFITTHHLLLQLHYSLQSCTSGCFRFPSQTCNSRHFENRQTYTHMHIPYTFQIQNSTAHPCTQRRKTGSGCQQAVQLHH